MNISESDLSHEVSDNPSDFGIIQDKGAGKGDKSRVNLKTYWASSYWDKLEQRKKDEQKAQKQQTK